MKNTLPSLIRRCVAALALCLTGPSVLAQDAVDTGLTPESIAHAQALRDRALASDLAYELVESLTTEVGPRLAASEAEARARQWAVHKLRALGFDTVRVEAFALQGWERGVERAAVLAPFPQPLSVTALGGSVATPPEGLEAEVALFETLSDLEAAAPGSLKGKIAYVGHAMQRTQDGSHYGYFGRARRRGASIAADRGAQALLIRSIGTDSHRFPHTGQMSYSEDVTRIPAAALSNPDADQLERIARRGATLRVSLTLTPRFTGERRSGNVIADIVGRERPEEFIVIGGHLDSWDLGTGAIDDGAGVAITSAAASHILAAGERPRRSIRLILWGAEEVGLVGGRAYLDAHRDELQQHIIGTESDFGAERIWQLTAQVSDEGQAVVDQLARMLEPLGIAPGSMDRAGAGPDLTHMVRAGLPSLRLVQNGSDYFDLHHTHDDTLDKIDPLALRQNVAAYVLFAWLAADSTVDFRAADR